MYGLVREVLDDGKVNLRRKAQDAAGVNYPLRDVAAFVGVAWAATRGGGMGNV